MLKNIQLKVLDPRIGQEYPLPQYQTEGSAGLDLYACLPESLVIPANQCVLLPTGIALYIKDPRYCAVIAPRSGLGHKKGIVLGNLVGVIDADYQGELKVSCWNRSTTPQTIEPMDRVAQLLFLPVLRPSFELVDQFCGTERGEGGFGSTGH
ncbi:dUTP diphosphatase [Candidatus Synchoanobacter obligatus]|uniref:Deoxyuridine 5'-triphosphate nucleotidohydrolase n=1 Tax=Candidatus Synchoanobacter obligatus TaxID=2919597 RepID=A0ABT1L5P1_9GAMM|nr:dUTP diphosphatase [Candidatus Synchoanobacter obligatus]MCP8352193.1 dUTP diphosphatase [Candidatus Synchoanobacter obligatus]